MMRQKQREKGQAAAEFALVFPTIALLIVGVVALFHGMAYLEVLQNAASEGGRAASVWRPDGVTTCVGVANQAVQRTTPWFDPANGDTVTVSASCPSGVWDRVPSGTLITVTVTVNWEPLFFSTLGQDYWEPPNSLPLSSTVTVRHE